MNSSIKESQPHYSSIPPLTEEDTNPFHQTSAQEKQPQMQSAAAASSSSSPPPPQSSDHDSEKWGTHVMGEPAVPTCHPDNKKAALWGAGDQAQYFHHPYL
ncbi:hypothetical protein CRYUN_Cryun17cG0003200 [Craigia yunnanensis]